MKTTLLSFILLFLVGCTQSSQTDPTQILETDTLKGAALLKADHAKTAVILCHGKGKNPRWKVVEPLRKAIFNQLDFTTLSIQMPVLATDQWQDYAETFPNAVYRIDQAVEYLQRQGIEHIYVMGHSMGSRMVSYYASQQNHKVIQGFIVSGCRNNGPPPLNCKANLKTVGLPVLDIWGQADAKDRLASEQRKNLVSDHYQQIGLDQAKHSFEGLESKMTQAVVNWLQSHD